MVVVDQTPECLKALRFAALRAGRTGGSVTMLYVIEPEEFQHWKTVADKMREEAITEAQARLDAIAEEVKALSGTAPDLAIREGSKREQVLAHIADDGEIGVLVLGAGEDSEGPGPLVTGLGGASSGRLPIPLTIVPGHLSLAQIDAIC